MKKIKLFKKISSIAGTVFGFISIILGSTVSNMSIGGHESNITYGGDAYTGMQNAAAQTANNVQCLADIVRSGLSGILIILGWAMICYFTLKFMSIIEENKNNPIEAKNNTEESTL